MYAQHCISKSEICLRQMQFTKSNLNALSLRNEHLVHLKACYTTLLGNGFQEAFSVIPFVYFGCNVKVYQQDYMNTIL